MYRNSRILVKRPKRPKIFKITKIFFAQKNDNYAKYILKTHLGKIKLQIPKLGNLLFNIVQKLVKKAIASFRLNFGNYGFHF